MTDAKERFLAYYMILIESDSDKGEELLVSLLSKQCAIEETKEKYNILMTFLLNLHNCGVIKSKKVYLARKQELIEQYQSIVKELEKL